MSDASLFAARITGNQLIAENNRVTIDKKSLLIAQALEMTT